MPEPVARSRGLALLGLALNRLTTRWATPGAGRVALCSPLVGLVAGLGAVAFLRLLELMYRYVLVGLMHFQMPPTGEGTAHAISDPWPWWMVLLVPTVGGLLSGLLVFTFAPEAEGHGTDALIRAFHQGGGQIRGRVPVIKGIASVITIGTGGSAGQEGPIAQIGAGFGSFLARLLRLTPSERRLLTLAGAAGGVGAIFRAPLGGALFGCEVLYRTAAMESSALLPCLASSIVAYSAFALFITPRPIFLVPDLEFHGLGELPLFVLLALACAGVGWLYVRVFYGLRDWVFKPLPLPRHVKPAVGGLLLGLIALAFPQLMTGGYGWVQWGALGMPPSLALPGDPVFTPHMGVVMLLSLAVLKTVTTGLTISSGGSGGVFGPSVFIGGMLGGAIGQLLRDLVPHWGVNPSAFALVGMGGFFAGVSKTPLTSIVMVCEMAGNYSLLVPLMLVCGLNMGLSRGWTIYEEQVPSPVDSPAHQGDFVVDVLERLRVDQVPMRSEGLERIAADMPFAEVVRRVARSAETLFLVVDVGGGLTGVFTLRDVRLALDGSDWGPLVVADDLAHRPVLSVTLADDLHTALKRLTALNVDELPVVAPDDPSRLIGLLNRRDLVAAYTAQTEALRSPDPDPDADPGEVSTMTETAKDFTPIQADYDFFVARSTEADADLEAHLEGLRRAGLAPGRLRMLDFGCGPGTFTARFLDRAGWPAEQLELALVEPVGDYRHQAVERLRDRTSLPIAAWEELPADLPHPFDLALSNHAFYYVPDQREALARIARALRPGGTFLASIAGKDNALVDFWFQAFPMLGRPVPYHTAEGFEEAVRGLGLPFSRQDVHYELSFPDSEDHRRKILRFLLGEYLELLPARTALGYFDPYASGGRIEVATRSYHYCVRCLA